MRFPDGMLRKHVA